MKKRLYLIIFSTYAAFFLFLTVLSYFYNEFIKNNLILFIVIAFVAITIISLILRKILLREAIKPINNLSQFIALKLMNKPMSEDLEEKYKKEIFTLLEESGYDSTEIEKGLEMIEDKSEIRRNFSANVSHELKSPLTSINGFAEMIAAGIAKGEEAEKFAEKILKEGNRLLVLIDETIQLSKIDNNQIRRESFKEFDIAKMTEEIVESYSNQVNQKKVDIQFNYKEQIYYGNERLIFDLIRNLVSNAVKYSDDRNPRLYIKLKDMKDNIKLTFKDNGIGISEEDQKHIFERFFVVDSSRGNNTGTGLGLSLVKNIANIHDGEVQVYSKLGEGSEFTVLLSKNIKRM